MSILELKKVSKIYHPKEEGEIRALDEFDLSLDEGEFLVVRGVSGSGKSTLLHILGLLDSPTSGSMLMDGAETTSWSDAKKARIRNEMIGIVLQDFGLIEYRSAYDNCMVPLYFSNKKFKSDKERIMEILETVGMKSQYKRTVSKLSGGQKQRVAIARALCNEPRIILADEPTGQLDSKNKEEICGLFHDIQTKGKTIVVVTHDEEFEKYATRVIHISDGRITEEYRHP